MLPAAELPPLVRSFVLKEGRKNDITCMAKDRRGHVYLAGVSDSKCVIFKLDEKLKTIEEMAKFGGSRRDDVLTDVAIDGENNIFVTGYTNNRDFPVTGGCYDSELARKGKVEQSESFVAKFSPSLKMVAATFIGGEPNDRAYAIAIDRDDAVYIAGYAEGGKPKYHQQFVPPDGAYDNRPAPPGQAKAFVVRLSNDLSRLEAATLLGGDLARYDSDDEAYDLAIDHQGNVWVAGQTNSADFPVSRGCVSPFYSGKGDVFVAKLSPDLSRLMASTYLGGMNQGMATAMVVDREGNVYVGGWTESTDLPMVDGCFDTRYSHEEEDAFIVKLSPDLKRLVAATFLGGNYDASGYGDDLLSAMDLSADGKTLCVAGRTESENFPVTDGCFKAVTNDNDTAFGDDNHRNRTKPRERSSGDDDYGDGFIALFDADLTCCSYATYLGGDSLEYVDDVLIEMVRFGSTQTISYFTQDWIHDMAVDGKGNVFVTGSTEQPDYPVTAGCYDSMFSTKRHASGEGFVTKFSPDLKLLASTFIGGDGREKIYAVAVDGQDNVFVAGCCQGAHPKYDHNFIPPAGAYDRTPADRFQTKAFIAGLSNDLTTLRGATLLGGKREKHKDAACVYDLAIDASGNVWVAGQTTSPDFPVTASVYGRGLAGKSDAFVTKLDTTLGQVLASTFIGGRADERANAIVIDPKGDVLVGGWSASPDMLAFVKGYDTEHSRYEEDVFVVRMDDGLREVKAGTFLGGEAPAGETGPLHGDDKLSCMRLSADGGTLFLAGRTESRDFDTTPPSRKAQFGNMDYNTSFDRGKAEGGDPDYGDGFIARFDASLTTLVSSSLFGGTSLEYIDDMLLSSQGVYLTGETRSVDFPGMAINYGFISTRGFVSRFDPALSKKYRHKQKKSYQPQFSDDEIKNIAQTLIEEKSIKATLSSDLFFNQLGSYAKKRTTREQFEAKLERAIFLYGKPALWKTEYHHHNYYQDGKDGYDWIELCYVERSMPNTTYRYSNPNASRIVLTIIAKDKKWQLADVDYRANGLEYSSKRMKKRLY